MPHHFLPATNQKSGDFSSWISIGVLGRIKYFSSFSLDPNQQQQQQASRRRKPKSIDAMVLLPSIAGKNYSIRHHCTGTWKATNPTLSVALYQPAVTTGLMRRVTRREFNHAKTSLIHGRHNYSVRITVRNLEGIKTSWNATPSFSSILKQRNR